MVTFSECLVYDYFLERQKKKPCFLKQSQKCGQEKQIFKIKWFKHAPHAAYIYLVTGWIGVYTPNSS